MKTIKAKTQAELNEILKSGSNFNLDLREWEEKNINLRSAKIEGYVDLTEAEIGGYVSLKCAKIGRYVSLTGAKIGRSVDLTEAGIEGNVSLTEAKIGRSVDLTEAGIEGNVSLTEAKIEGYVSLTGAEIEGYVYLRGAEIEGNVIQNYTKEDIEFLRSIPIDILEMETWQTNENWKKCKTEKELHTCGTAFCIRGYAEAKYFVENGKEVEDKNTLFPNLKHLFYMTNEQAKKEIEKIIA